MIENLKKMDPKQAELLVLTQVRKYMGQSHELQKLNFDVHVQVHRLPNVVGCSIMQHAKDAANSESLYRIKSEVQKNTVPTFQLRADHELRVQGNMVGIDPALSEAEKAEKYDLYMRENYIYPNGGYVKVEFKHPVTEKMYIGEAHCHIFDQFNKKKSQFNAWLRIYRQLLKDSSMGVKAGKRVVRALLTSSK